MGRFPLIHIGASVGAATVQLAAVQLVLEADDATGAARVVERGFLGRRRPPFTPYLPDGSLDVGAVGFLLLEMGANSPVLGKNIGGRVAALSGYAAAEENAYWIGRALAEIDYSPYVCLRAGPHLGAVLAAYGGGAVAGSLTPEGEPRTVLNVDLGASVTKLALCRGGEVRETAAIALGTRSLALDAAGGILELRPAAARAAEDAGVSLRNGAAVDAVSRSRLGRRLADCVVGVITQASLDPLARGLMLTAPLSEARSIDAVSFTGGGAEYLYGRVDRDFGDLGGQMALAIREGIQPLGVALEEPEHPLWATALGGMHYRLQDGEVVFAEPASFAAARERDRQFLASPERAAITTS